MTASRDLTGPGQTRAIRDLLQSLFAIELLSPSRRLWLGFGWITDIDILDNEARQFSALQPDWPAAAIRLSAVIEALANKGCEVIVLTRDHPHNVSFVDKMRALGSANGGAVRVLVTPDFHEKGILGDGYVLSGSMNLTWSGITVNDEHVLLRRDPAAVAERRIQLEEKWGHGR
ncbi:phospholipase D-like domain-containing protein [Mesorhizobium sp. M0938]|uniref:phospholipase D-like domain-containing protein DpdK n=1 Tax=Mesorhizobium TaxID=68287 RepID=UPI001459FEEE|nr:MULTISPECIES: phospholipase D-like domain-containing protein DpdK [Mesorhizobium]